MDHCQYNDQVYIKKHRSQNVNCLFSSCWGHCNNIWQLGASIDYDEPHLDLSFKGTGKINMKPLPGLLWNFQWMKWSLAASIATIKSGMCHWDSQCLHHTGTPYCCVSGIQGRWYTLQQSLCGGSLCMRGGWVLPRQELSCFQADLQSEVLKYQGDL